MSYLDKHHAFAFLTLPNSTTCSGGFFTTAPSVDAEESSSCLYRLSAR